MAESKYSVSWNAYQKSICNGLSSLQQRVSYQTLESILQYAYTGEVVVSTDRIQEFLNACKELHIRGLEECMNYLDSAKSEEPSHSSPGERDTTSHVVPKKRDRSTVQDNPLFEVSVPTYDDDDTPADFSLDFDNDDDMKSPMDNSEQQQSTAKIVKNEPTSYIGDKTDTTLKFSMSNMGTPQIVLNRYVYFLRSPRQNGENMWRCVHYKRARCRAYIIVKDYKVLKRSVKKLSSRSIDTTLKYTVSNKATTQIVLNRYLYFLRSPRKNGETMWRCVNYTRYRCRAHIVLRDHKVVKRSVKKLYLPNFHEVKIPGSTLFA
ncbi:Mod(Mdg4) protein [Operophtera brumata]|uniref:Mod(Mdg4) protein n=1 Tax=Operophtera brumata TaxID=104452 RepID=A0A0L7KQT8_OPEBR|nr:Mod(Mdg4) protein [Operophtera brumata]